MKRTIEFSTIEELRAKADSLEVVYRVAREITEKTLKDKGIKYTGVSDYVFMVDIADFPDGFKLEDLTTDLKFLIESIHKTLKVTEVK